MMLDADADHVLIRMYNVGFGDCFLLVFPASDRPRKVLIDCGSHSAGRGPASIQDVCARVVSDVAGDGGVARIDLVIATHRHQDHVSGFDNKAWQDVEVTEVWMPWTEDPTDPAARRIRERQSAVARSLCLALQAAGSTETDPAMALAKNSLTNAKAMETLHRGFAGNPKRRFLPNKEPGTNSFVPDPLPGVNVHAMGPSRDESVIRDMDPPAGVGYLRLIDGQTGEGDNPGPFRGGWEIAPEQFLATGEFSHLELTKEHISRINKLSDTDHFAIAAALEKAVNGTSLMLAFEVGDALLLFPGDAQWGTWNAVLQNERWRDTVARTTFYKIGHHGSHNATPREYIESLIGSRRTQPGAFVANFRAAVSTRHMDMWKFIPKPELLKAIGETTESLARSDIRDKIVPGFTNVDELVTETRVPIRS